MSNSENLSFRTLLPGGRVLFDNKKNVEDPNYKYVELDPCLVYQLYEDEVERQPHVMQLTKAELDSFLDQEIGTRNQHMMDVWDAVVSDPLERKITGSDDQEVNDNQPQEGVIWVDYVWTDGIGRRLTERYPDLWTSNFDTPKDFLQKLEASALGTALARIIDNPDSVDPVLKNKEDLARLERRTKRALQDIFGLGAMGVKFVVGNENNITEQSIYTLIHEAPCAERTLTCILLAEEHIKKAKKYFGYASMTPDEIGSRIKPERQATWVKDCAQDILSQIGQGITEYAKVFAEGNEAFLPSETWHRPHTWGARLETLGGQLLDHMERWNRELASHATVEDRVNQFRILHIASFYFPENLCKSERFLGTYDSESLIDIAYEAVKINPPYLVEIVNQVAFLIGVKPEYSLLILRLIDAHLERANLCLTDEKSKDPLQDYVRNIDGAITYFREAVQLSEKEPVLFVPDDIRKAGQKILDAMDCLPSNQKYALAQMLEPHLPEGFISPTQAAISDSLRKDHAAIKDWMKAPDSPLVLSDGCIAEVPAGVRDLVKRFNAMLAKFVPKP